MHSRRAAIMVLLELSEVPALRSQSGAALLEQLASLVPVGERGLALVESVVDVVHASVLRLGIVGVVGVRPRRTIAT